MQKEKEDLEQDNLFRGPMKEYLNKINHRYISAAILIPATLIVTFIGGILFNILIITATCILLYEAISCIIESKLKDNLKKYLPYIITYISLPAAALITIRQSESGIELILLLLLIVWITDSFAYFGGRYFKGPKLAEKISPNKTISGAASGLVGTVIFSFLAYFLTDNQSLTYFLFATALISIASQAGDLIESYAKRILEIKDSGNLIPGHGGLFDRLDGLLPASLIAYILLF